MSFITEKILEEGVDYDSVLILPMYSKTKYEDVDISARFSRSFCMQLPFVLEVNNFQNIHLTEIIAQQGGVGVLGSNLDLKTRVEYIKSLKKNKGLYSGKFFCVNEDTEVEHVIKLISKLPGSRIVVLGEDGKFQYVVEGVSALSLNEYRVLKVGGLPDKYKQGVNVVKLSSKIEIFKLAFGEYKSAVVIEPETGEVEGYTSCSILDEYEKYPLANRCEDGSLMIVSKVASTENIDEEVGVLNEAGVDAVIIEYEHPHSKWVLEEIKHLKLDFPKLEILIENITSSAGATDHLLAGVDGVVVGQRTKDANRKIGVGVPLPTAIYNVYKAIKHSDISLLLSGGLKNEGNMVKSLATGVDALWLNNLIDNADKCEEEVLIKHIERLAVFVRKGVCYSGNDNLKSFKQSKFMLNTTTLLSKS
ncbi:MAG: IMP dehydrogenase [Bacteroidales bacterium]